MVARPRREIERVTYIDAEWAAVAYVLTPIAVSSALARLRSKSATVTAMWSITARDVRSGVLDTSSTADAV